MEELLQYYAARGLSRVFKNDYVAEEVGSFAVTRRDHSAVAERVWEFGEQDEFTFEPPVSLDPAPAEIRNKYGYISISKPFVSEFSDVELVGPDAISLTPDGPILENSIGSPQQIFLSVLRTLRNGMAPIRRQPSRSVETAVSLVGPWDDGYYHWISDYLLRVEGLLQYEESFDKRPDVIIPQNPPSWMEETLCYAGVPEDRWMEWDGGRLTVSSLIVPSLRRETTLTADNKGYVFSPQAYRQLANQTMRTVDPDLGGSERIYISREQANSRRVLNREELLIPLSKLDFKKYILEDLSVCEQVELFANADCIVAPTGAGLTNMIYATDATVVTLFGADVNSCYPVLASGLGLKSAFLMGDADGVDIRVDPSKLVRLLDELGIE